MRQLLPYALAAISLAPADALAQASRQTIWVGRNTQGLVDALNADEAGPLTPTLGSPFPAATNPQGIAVTPDGRFLACVSAGQPTIENLHFYSVNFDGSLTPAPGSPFPVNDGPLGLEADPLNRFIFTPSAGTDRIHVHAIQGGTLAQVPGSPFVVPDFPVELKATPDGRFLYASHLNGTITAYSIAPSGTLTPIPGFPVTVGTNGAFEIIISPNGKFLYVGLGLMNAIGAYQINHASGSLSPVTGQPFSTSGSSAVNLCITPNGRFVYVCHVASVNDTLGGMLADPEEGTLSQLPFSFFFGADIRKCVTDGKFLYVTDESSINQPVGVRTFLIDQSTGIPTEIPGSPFGPNTGRPADLTIFVPPCPADLNKDRTTDLTDFFEFFNCYDAELPCADVNGIDGVDLADFFDFFASYDQGCWSGGN